MSEREVIEMQKSIDKGIFLAQKRLVERAKLMGTTLVVCRNGKVLDIRPEDL
ncbi:MAG: hypothetical protein K6F94_07355 [Bacteroidaceae bacterium]|nr:hypothetical protein [Bacteroidaceae bacterium]